MQRLFELQCKLLKEGYISYIGFRVQGLNCLRGLYRGLYRANPEIPCVLPALGCLVSGISL